MENVSEIGTARTVNAAVPAGAELLRQVANEAKRIEDEALYNHAGHNVVARFHESLYRWLGLPAVILAAAAGLSSLTAAADTAVPWSWVAVLAGALAFAVAALSGATSFLDPKARAAEHYRAANAYAALRMEARYFHRIECAKGQVLAPLETTLIALWDRLVKLDGETPIIPTNAMRAGGKGIAQGEYVHEVDRENSPRVSLRAGIAP